MKIPSPRTRVKARIEIIPLIDVIFFLLATFVMVSLSMIKNRGIPMNLPVALTGLPQEHKEHASISVTEAGEFLFNREKIDKSQLTLKLGNLKASNPDTKVFIHGDAKTDFENIVSVLDEARKLGITKVTIETKTRPGIH